MYYFINMQILMRFYILKIFQFVIVVFISSNIFILNETEFC